MIKFLNQNRDIYQILSQNMKKYRKQQNISQKEFATMSRLPESLIHSLELGNRSISIDTDILERLANTLQISIVELLKEKE